MQGAGCGGDMTQLLLATKLFFPRARPKLVPRPRLIERLDAGLRKPYRQYLPQEPGEGDGPLAINVIYGNSAQHFTEHRAWIEALVGRA